MGDRTFALLPLLLAALWMGCPGEEPDDDTTKGDDDDTGDDDDDIIGDDDSADCTFSDPWMTRFDVLEEYDDGDWRGRIHGWVKDGPEPVWHEVVAAEGVCQTLAFTVGDCDPPCDWPEFCSADDTCVGFPAGVSGGLVDVEGLSFSPTVVDHVVPGFYEAKSVPDNLFDAGDGIRVELSQFPFPDLTLVSRGVAPMDTSLAGHVVSLTDGQDALVSWPPGPDPEACVDLWLRGINATHGLPLNDLIHCRTVDRGELTIPASVIEAFPPGESMTDCISVDCPPSELTRFTRDVVVTDQGSAELWISSRIEVGWLHGP